MEIGVSRAFRLNAVPVCAVFLSLLELSEPAIACATFHERDLNYFSNAQIVVRARMISYQPIFDPELQERRRQFREALSKNGTHQSADSLSDRSVDSARMKFEVKETISGFPRLGDWEAIWVNSTFEMADQWTGPENVIVGLRAAIDRHGAPIIEVIQQPCAPVMILEDTRDNRNAITNALRDQGRRHAGYVFQ
ncbi:hypothetical protein [Mesorhizobium sp. RIZ17]|uniref:hypothetical protein n=1 Tax=Mesorhizobium sp. RIZ17 TaxID=3132743 RepID=UPI003DA8845B